jgi:hypothetical protein
MRPGTPILRGAAVETRRKHRRSAPVRVSDPRNGPLRLATSRCPSVEPCPASLRRSIGLGTPTRPGGCSQGRRARQKGDDPDSPFSSQAGASSQADDVPAFGEMRDAGRLRCPDLPSCWRAHCCPRGSHGCVCPIPPAFDSIVGVDRVAASGHDGHLMDASPACRTIAIVRVPQLDRRQLLARRSSGATCAARAAPSGRKQARGRLRATLTGPARLSGLRRNREAHKG